MTVTHTAFHVLTSMCRTFARYGTSATFVFKVAHALCFILHKGASQMFDQANNALYCLGNSVPPEPPTQPPPLHE